MSGAYKYRPQYTQNQIGPERSGKEQVRNDLHWLLKNWHAMHGAPEVELHEFGDNGTVMPVCKDGSWTTTSVCYLCVRGEDKPNMDTPKVGEVTYAGGGWFFYGVEMKLGTTHDELFSLLDKAKEKLLAGVKEHAQT